MYKEIENKFKSHESNHNNKCVFIICFTFYIIIAIVMTKLIGNNVFTIIVPLLIFFLLMYSYMVWIHLKDRRYKKMKWHYIFRMKRIIELNKKKQRKKDKKLLIKLLKQNGVNTAQKVKTVLEHYRVLIPRNTNNRMQLISIMAFFISILAFFYDSNIKVAIEKLLSSLIVIFLVLIGCFICYLYKKEILGPFNKIGLYLKIEDLLTEIYINSEIK